MSKQLWLRPLVAALGCVLFTAACGDDDENNPPPPPPPECYDPDATPYVIGAANPQGVAGGTVEYAKFATPVAVFEINRSCGVLGDANGALGVPISIQEVDPGTDVTLARTVTQQLVDAGVRAMTGIGSNPTTMAASSTATKANVLMGSYIGFDNALSGCTAAELANPAVTKSLDPVNPNGTQCWNNGGLFFRLSHKVQEWARMTVAKGFDDQPSMTQAGVLIAPNGTARQFGAGFIEKLGQKGIAGVTAVEMASNNPQVADLVTSLKTMSAGHLYEALFVFIPQANVRNLVEAYVQARDDAGWAEKPANFSNLHIYVAPPTYGTTYSTLSPAGLAFMSSPRFVSVGVNFDLAFEGTARYAQVLQDYSPTETIESVQTLRNYDMYLLFALAITKVGASATATEIAQAVRDIANGPGEVVYADEYQKAKELILAGEDVDYEGASGPVEFNERNDAVGMVYNTALVDSTGEAYWTTTPIVDD